MNSDEMMDIWKERKTQVETHRDFADKVMNQLHNRGSHRRTPVFDVYRVIEIISSSPAATAAVIALGAIAGIVRVSIVILSFLAF
jgi:hypothetical protein